jgi:hypothetical protein
LGKFIRRGTLCGGSPRGQIVHGGDDGWRVHVIQLGKPVEQRTEVPRELGCIPVEKDAEPLSDFFADRPAMQAVELRRHGVVTGHEALPSSDVGRQ